MESSIARTKLKFDIVQGQFTWPCGYVAVKIGLEYRVPSIIMVGESHDWLYEMEKSNNPLPTWSWKNANALIRGAEKDVSFFKKYNPNIASAVGGYDPGIFHPIDKAQARDSLDLPKGNPIIFALGELTERKGFQYLITAVGDLIKEFPTLRCLIGGSGPLKG